MKIDKREGDVSTSGGLSLKQKHNVAGDMLQNTTEVVQM